MANPPSNASEKPALCGFLVTVEEPRSGLPHREGHDVAVLLGRLLVARIVCRPCLGPVLVRLQLDVVDEAPRLLPARGEENRPPAVLRPGQFEARRRLPEAAVD